MRKKGLNDAEKAPETACVRGETWLQEEDTEDILDESSYEPRETEYEVYNLNRISKRGRPRKSSNNKDLPYIRPIPNITEEGRESQLIAMAVDLAERQLMEGTASSQVITHFLKLGTQQAKLEREKLARETELLRAKAEALRSAKRVEELYEEALKAMRTYSGKKDDLV